MVFRRRLGRLVGGIVLCCGLIGWARSGIAEGRLTIAVDGESDYVIATAQDADPERIRLAADLLHALLAEAAGVELPIVSESAVPAGAPAIYLGRSRSAAAAGIPIDDLKGWAFHNRTVGRNIYLAGADEAVSHNPHAYFGAYKAVTAFLHDQIGVRFVLPGAMGRHVSRLDRLTVDADMNVRWAPVFEWVGSRPVLGHDADNRMYAVANNLPFQGNTPDIRHSTHSHTRAVPARRHGESNPEFFALRGGIRNPAGGHLCLANEEVRNLILRYMEDAADAGNTWVELGQTDGYQACECDGCAAISEDIGERLWIAHRDLAEHMLERRPGLTVMILSYANTNDPPRTFDRFPPNVAIQLCRYDADSFRLWSPFEVPKAVYLYNWLGPWPRISPREALAQVRRFERNDVRGIEIAGGLDRGGPWGLYGPSYYAFGRALEDPSLDADALEYEYVTAAFGEAAGPMRRFFQVMHRQISPRVSYPTLSHHFTPRALNEMRDALGRAMEMAQDERVIRRLALLDAEFRYLRSVAVSQILYNAFVASPSWPLFDALEEGVQAYHDTVAWLFSGAEALDVAPGLRRPFSGRRMHEAQYGSVHHLVPFSWEFGNLREHGVLPGQAAPRIAVSRVDPFEIDGRLDTGPWKDIEFHELGGVSLGRIDHPSRFALAMDAEAVYIAFEAEFSAADALDYLRPAGRDGRVWGQENLEIMLDPFGERERYYHFMLNPVDHSLADRRFGYYDDDPLHPYFNRFEPFAEWRGDWTYIARIDREGLRWTAEVRIPFTTLETEAPGPGSVWTLNIGRTEFPDGTDGHGGRRVFSLWSPNLETRSFHQRSAFGEAVFR